MTIQGHDNAGPVDLEPLCSEEEFAEEVRGLVADEAPQVFALVEECGERVDGRIVAWGMTFDGHVEVVSVNGGVHVSLDSAERAQWAFSRRRTVRLVWIRPTPVSGDASYSGTPFCYLHFWYGRTW